MIRNKIILLLALSMVIIVGCTEDYLDTVPTDSISEEAALSNPDNMMLVLNGLHRMMVIHLHHYLFYLYIVL